MACLNIPVLKGMSQTGEATLGMYKTPGRVARCGWPPASTAATQAGERVSVIAGMGSNTDDTNGGPGGGLVL